MSEKRDCGAEVAAYALGALDEREAAAFRRHLAECAVCHDELAAFAQVVDTLPVATSQLTAPRGLRKRLMRAVRQEAKANRSAPGQRRTGSGAFGFAVPRAALAATMAVAAAAVIGGLELSSSGSGSTRVIQASVIGSPGSARLELAGAQAELIVSHFPPPPAGRIYEVWLQRPQRGLTPTRALFSVTSNGAGDVGIPGGIRGVSAVLVTQEPAGGSLTPTHAPVIIARLT